MSAGPPEPARAALSRERIVSATVELIERDGAEAVSMRRVAALLGVAPMSLYNHVPNKASLLDAVAERIMTEVVPPDPGPAAPDPDWCDQARTLARGFRAVARRYPRSVLVAINREPRGSVGLRPVERALAAVRQAGFDDQTSVRLMRTFVAFILGSMLREAGAGEPRERPTAEGSADNTAADNTAADNTAADNTAADNTAADNTAADNTALAVALRAGHFPHVSAVLPMLVEHDHDADFEFGLELLIGAMQAALPAGVSAPVSTPVSTPTGSSDPLIAGDRLPG